MGQAGAFPAISPNSAKMAFGWPNGRKQFFPHVRTLKCPVSTLVRGAAIWMSLYAQGLL